MKNYLEQSFFPLLLVLLLIGSIALSWYSFKMTFHGHKIFLPELMILLLIAGGIPCLLLSGVKVEIEPALWPMVVLGLMTLSSIFSIKPVVALKETLRWAEIFIAFFFTSNLIRGAREVKWTLLLILVAGIIHTLWGMKLMSDIDLSGGLVTPYFDNPNQMALFLDFCFPVAAAFLIAERDTLWRIWWIYCFSLVGLALCWTRSRGALISNGFVLVLFVLIILYRKTGKTFFLNLTKRVLSISLGGPIVLLFALLFFVIFSPGLTERLLKATESGTARTVSSRLYHYVTGLQMVEDFPLTGVGGNLYKEVAPFYVPYYASKDLIESLKQYHLHSLYVKLAAENGILSLLAFLFFLRRLGYDAILALSRLKRETYWLLAGTAGSALAWVLHNIVDEGFSFMAILLGILLGLIVSLRRCACEDADGKGDPSLSQLTS